MLEKSFAEVVSSAPTASINVNKHSDNLSVVVKNLPFDQRESRDNSIVTRKISELFKDGLKSPDLDCVKVERKVNRSNNNKPGLTVVELKTLEDKKRVLGAKKSLKNSKKYERVYIENHVPFEQRVMNNNNRTILKALGKDSDFTTRSGRIIRKQYDQRVDERRDRALDSRGSPHKDNEETRKTPEKRQFAHGKCGRGKGA